MATKPLDNIKFSILNFIKPLLSKTLVLAIKKLLNPCCVITATAAWTCTATNTATLVLTLNRSTNLLGNGLFRVNVANGAVVRTYTGTFIDGSTITVPSVATPGGGGSVTITGNLLLPTDLENADTGVFIRISTITSTAPACA